MLPEGKKFTLAALSEDSERSLPEKYNNKEEFLKDLKENIQKSAPKIVNDSFEAIDELLKKKGIDNRKIIADTQNVEAETQNKYSDLELKEIQKHKEIEELRGMQITNDHLNNVKNHNEKIIKILEEKKILFYINNNNDIILIKDIN